MIYDKKFKKKLSILYVVRLEPTISMLTAKRSIQRVKRDSDEYRIRKYITLKSILFIMFGNLKLVLRRFTSFYGIFMSASLTLYIYTQKQITKTNKHTLSIHWPTQNNHVLLYLMYRHRATFVRICFQID